MSSQDVPEVWKSELRCWYPPHITHKLWKAPSASGPEYQILWMHPFSYKYKCLSDIKMAKWELHWHLSYELGQKWNGREQRKCGKRKTPSREPGWESRHCKTTERPNSPTKITLVFLKEEKETSRKYSRSECTGPWASIMLAPTTLSPQSTPHKATWQAYLQSECQLYVSFQS